MVELHTVKKAVKRYSGYRSVTDVGMGNGLIHEYEMLHFGRSYLRAKYTVKDRTLNGIVVQRDLMV